VDSPLATPCRHIRPGASACASALYVRTVPTGHSPISPRRRCPYGPRVDASCMLYVGHVRTGGVGQLAPRRHAPHVYHAPYTYQHVDLPRVPRTVHLPVCTLTTYTAHCTLTLQRHALDTYQFVHLPVCYAYQYVRTTLITCTTHCTLTSMYTVRRTRTRLVACMRMYRMYLG
jgi:hypothetical protein